MTPSALAQLSQTLAGQSDAVVNAALKQRHLSAEESLAVRLEIEACRTERRMAAQGELGTDQGLPRGTLATDLPEAQYTPESAPVSREMAAWLRKAGLSVDRRYSDREVTSALEGSGLSTLERMSVRAELYDRGLVGTSGARPVQASARHLPPGPGGLTAMDRLLVKLGTDLSGIQGLTERELDAKLTEAGISDPVERIAVKTELVSRKLIAPPRPTVQATRDLRAAAERPRPTGQVLRNADGSLRVLRGSWW